MDHPQEPVPPRVKPEGDVGDPISTRTFIVVAFIIVVGMILWARAMIGY